MRTAVVVVSLNDDISDITRRFDGLILELDGLWAEVVGVKSDVIIVT